MAGLARFKKIRIEPRWQLQKKSLKKRVPEKKRLRTFGDFCWKTESCIICAMH